MTTSIDRWHLHASVRTKEPPSFDFDPDKLFYSVELSSLLGIPQVLAEIPSEQHAKVLTYDLLRFHEFTYELEVGVVNGELARLSLGKSAPWLDEERRHAAVQMLTDEGGHAEMSAALITATRAATGITPLLLRPNFLIALERTKARVDSGLRNDVETLFTCISETLITGTLTKLPHDERVQDSVREVNRLHAIDEARHHKFFRQLFLEFWPRLEPAAALTLGPLLPSMIAAFLDPDIAYMRRVLAEVLPRSVSGDEVLADILANGLIRLGAYGAAQPSLRMMEEAGVFEDPATEQAFVDMGFVR